MSYAHLDAPLRLGPITLGNRALFLPEYLAHLSEVGPSQLTALLIGAAVGGFAAVGLGRFRHASSPSPPPGPYWPAPARDLRDEATLREAADLVARLPDSAPAHATLESDGQLGAAIAALAGAGVRLVEIVWDPSRAGLIEAAATGAPAEIALGLRLEVGPEDQQRGAEEIEALRELLARSPALRFVHIAPGFDRRLTMWGGSKRYPLIDDAAALLAGVSAALMVSGRFKNGEEGDRALRYHPLQLIGYSRAGLADPALLRAGRARGDWMPCTGCMACFPAPAVEGIGCAVNPWTHGEPADLDFTGLSVAVVGASLPGLEVARRVQAGGGRASVHRLGQALGGRVRLRGRIPQQAESVEAAMFMRRELDRLGVVVEADCTPELVDQADQVILSLPGRHLLPTAFADAAGAAEEGAVIDAATLLAGGTHTPGPFAVVGDTLLAAESVAYLVMTGRNACLVSERGVAADSHPSWAARYEALFAHRGLPVVSMAAVSPRADGGWSIEGWEARVETLVAAGGPSPDPALELWRARWTHARELPDVYEPWRQRAAMREAADLLRDLGARPR